MIKKTNSKNFYLDNLATNIKRVEEGLPILHPKKVVKPAIKNKGVINISIDPLPKSPPAKLPGVDWDQLHKNNKPKKSSDLNYLMGVDDE